MFSLRNTLCTISSRCLKPTSQLLRATSHYCTQKQIGKTVDASESGTNKRLSKAMRAYVERSKVYNEFVSREQHEFNIGKRHLANMMGRDAETFTQQDIDEAIEYLLPSGLFEKKARPFMKEPSIVFPAKKEAQFDETGRPFHFLFYTGRPNFYNTLHEAVKCIKQLNKTEDDAIRRKPINPVATEELNLATCRWLSKEELEKKLVEEIVDQEYQHFVHAMEHIAQHKYVNLVKSFVMEYRTPLKDLTQSLQAPEVVIDDKGRSTVTTLGCPRKSARADVTVISPGTGKITINGKNIEYFRTIQSRNQILFPLEFSGLKDTVDIEATVVGGGETGQSGAIRWGIAWGLRPFVSPDTVESMRLAGLLTRDPRRRERKKPGQAKARRKFTWKKR